MSDVDRGQALHKLYLVEALLKDQVFASVAAGRRETFYCARWSFLAGDFKKCIKFCDDCVTSLIAAYSVASVNIKHMLSQQERATALVDLYSAMSTEDLINLNITKKE